MEVRVRVPTPLRQLVAGASTLVVDAGDTATVGSVLDAVALTHPALEGRGRDELGRTWVHVNLFVGPDNIRDREGLATPVTDGDELSIIPAISGG
jgi:molybdopterin converting factor small subunit